jgi:hypothetical protein
LVRELFELRLPSNVLVAGKAGVARGALRTLSRTLRFNVCSRPRSPSPGWKFWRLALVDKSLLDFAAVTLCDGEPASLSPTPSVLAADCKLEWLSGVGGRAMAWALGIALERPKECSIAPDLKRNAPTKQNTAKGTTHLVMGVLGDGDCLRMTEGDEDVDGDGATAELLRGTFRVHADSGLGLPPAFRKGLATTRS